MSEIPEGKKWQKVCHDDSSPPFSSFCSYCSGSKNCYSEDKRLVDVDEPDQLHIEYIRKLKEFDKKFNEGVDACIEFMKNKGTIYQKDADYPAYIIHLLEQLKKPIQ